MAYFSRHSVVKAIHAISDHRSPRIAISHPVQSLPLSRSKLRPIASSAVHLNHLHSCLHASVSLQHWLVAVVAVGTEGVWVRGGSQRTTIHEAVSDRGEKEKKAGNFS